MRKVRIIPIALSLAAAGSLLTGCSGGTGLTTSSLLTGSTPGAGAPAAKVAETDPTTRALQVAALSARAEKCGYNFDPNRIRTAYLQSESQQGATPEQLAGVTRAYDFTRQKVGSEIADDDDYCTDARTRDIKTKLTRYLAGDFSAERQVAAASGGWFDTSAGPSKREVLNPDWVNDPNNISKTRRVGD